MGVVANLFNSIETSSGFCNVWKPKQNLPLPTSDVESLLSAEWWDTQVEWEPCWYLDNDQKTEVHGMFVSIK